MALGARLLNFLGISNINLSFILQNSYRAPTTGNGYQFGNGLSANGDYFVVGEPGRIDGRVHVYYKDQGGVLDSWGINKIMIPPVSGDTEGYGFQVDLFNDYLIVGAPYASVDIGKAYIYQKDLGGIDNWGLVTTISNPNNQSGDFFGISVAINDEFAFIGSVGTGNVYAYSKASGWSLSNTISSPSPSNSEFGSYLCVKGNNILVSDPKDGGSTDGISNAGEAYIFNRDEGGLNNWGLVKTLSNPSDSLDYFFGQQITIGDNFAAIGGSISGSSKEVFIFEKDLGSPNNWVLSKTIVESSINQFPMSLHLDGNDLYVRGASPSVAEIRVYSKDKDGFGNWGFVTAIPGEGKEPLFFGDNVRVTGNNVIIANKNDRLGSRAAVGQVFRYLKSII